MTSSTDYWPRAGVGVVIWRDNEVLLVKRGKQPRAGQWSLPGGRQLVGETVREAAIREVLEETGLNVELSGLIDVVDSITYDLDDIIEYHYTLIVFSAEYTCGEAQPGDDAADVCWMHIDSLSSLNVWDETQRVLCLSAAHREVGM